MHIDRVLLEYKTTITQELHKKKQLSFARYFAALAAHEERRWTSKTAPLRARNAQRWGVYAAS